MCAWGRFSSSRRVLFVGNLPHVPFPQGHNRYWSHLTTYAKQNGGPYEFIFNNRSGNYGMIGVPTEQEFWDYFMATARKWGRAVYEQVRVLLGVCSVA